jgi:phytanoyl-CoA hydroxylase
MRGAFLRLGSQQIEQFDRDGFLIVERLLDTEDVERVRAAMDRILAGEYRGDRRPPALRSRHHPVFGEMHTTHWVLNSRLVDETIWSIVTRSEIGGAVAALLQTDSVSVVEDQLLDKPGGGSAVASHQDYRYWQFSTSTRMATCWIALDEMSRDLGPVEVIPGSHRWGQHAATRSLADDFREAIDGGNVYLEVAEALRPPETELKFVPVLVPAGGGVFFHSLTVHSSQANRSDRRRRALSIHYASAECRIDLTKTVDQAFPYCFARLMNGDRLVNTYLPQVYP